MTLYDGCSESAEPSAKRLSQMTRLMKEESASVIFYPELTTGKAAFAIAEETGARALMLHSCHNLSNDDYKAGEDYISLMQNNIQSIREAIS
jgi:zinc transport system substrate-binding protein